VWLKQAYARVLELAIELGGLDENWTPVEPVMEQARQTAIKSSQYLYYVLVGLQDGDGKIIAVAAWLTSTGGTGWSTVAVHQDYRGQGIAKALLTWFLSGLTPNYRGDDKAVCEVGTRLGNEGMLALLTSLGFQQRTTEDATLSERMGSGDAAFSVLIGDLRATLKVTPPDGNVPQWSEEVPGLERYGLVTYYVGRNPQHKPSNGLPKSVFAQQG
jgi:GNAT superfamily N-acetyltransferase